MYKLMIAEDEAIVRNGILRVIDWNELGFEVCGAAEDGLEALEMIRKNQPDVLITDVKMPGMSGLELLHALNAEKRRVCAVILTGYAEFEYAKAAVSERAAAYVLKMDVLEELPRVMRRIRGELEAQVQMDPESMREELKRRVTAACDPVLEGLRGSAMEQAVAYVLEHYTEHLRMEEVAARFYMNPSYFSRQFREKTGESFSQMTSRLRLNWARELLEHSAMRVSDVARAAGYTEMKHFNDRFKREFGKTPSQCRENARSGQKMK